MKDGFPDYYSPTDEEYARLWAKGVFVFDANVLLNLYRYDEQTRIDFFKVAKSLAERVWVPHQAEMEYERNRLSVIEVQQKQFRDAGKIVDSRRIEEGLNQYNDPKRTPFKIDKFLEALQTVKHEFKTYLNSVKEKQIAVDGKDPIRTELAVLFQGKTGPPFDQGRLDEIYADGEGRYGRETPPGYVDVKKKKGGSEYDCQGRRYNTKFGDLVLWKQILDWAKLNSIKNVVLVSDDRTEDWWQIIDSGGPKTIGPRPELRAEIRLTSGVELFWMYELERFLKYGGQSQHVSVQEASVEQVRTVRAVDLMRDATITFKSGLWWNFDRGAVGFRALVNGREVPCLISEESLQDYFGADPAGGGDAMKAAFEKNRRTIELIAKDAIRNGRIDATGTVLISTRDVEAGLAKKKVDEVKRYAVVLATQAWELAIKLGREAPLPVGRMSDSIKTILKEVSDAHELLADIRSEIDPVLWEQTKVDDGRTGVDIFDRLADVIEDLIRLERQIGGDEA
jgi:hypothetical protein